MTITHYMPTAPTGLVASLADGGSLDANTTYYLVVVAADGGLATRVDLANWSPTIYSPYSSEISVTTTTAQRTINLSWNQVMKPQYPTTQVDGYIVLVSKTPNIANLDDTAQIAYCPRGYIYLPTLTNSISITGNPTVRWHNVRYGLPFVRGLGDAPHTIEDLANYYKTNLPNHYQQIGISPSNPVGHVFYGIVVFNNYSAGTTFTAINTDMVVFGNINVYGKIYFDKVYLRLFGSSHGYGICFSYTDFASSIIRDCMVNLDAGKQATLYNSVQKTWVVGSLHINFYRYMSGGIGQALTDGVNVAPDSSNAKNIYRFTSTRLDNGFSGVYFCGRSSSWDANVVDCAKNGGIIYQYPVYGATWNSATYSFALGILDAGNYTQFLPHYLDSYWRYNNDSLYGTTEGFLPKIYISSSYQSFKNYTMSFWRSIRVFVKDERGNPVPNARVSFWSMSRGTNLTHGNSSDQMVKQRPDYQNTTYNWDSSDVNFQHNANFLWLYDWNDNGGANAPRYVTTGNTYWMQAEKVKIVQQLPDTPYKSGVTKFSVQRGVDNTITQWQYLYAPYSTGCFFAPDYHLTDASGFIWNPTLIEVYKKNLTGITTGTYTVQQLISNGWFDYYAYYPIKIRVEKSGYVTAEVVLDYQQILSSGAKQLEVPIVMKVRRQ